jgi:hypothetical protein
VKPRVVISAIDDLNSSKLGSRLAVTVIKVMSIRDASVEPRCRYAELASNLLSSLVPAGTSAGPGTNGIIRYFIS